MGVTKQDVIDFARTWIGTRWKHQGRTKGHGVDCIGLIIGVAHELRLSLFDTTQYTPVPDGVRLRQQCDELMIPASSPLPGRIVLMSFKGPPQHLGILSSMGGVDAIIHAYCIDRKVVEHPIDQQWRDRFLAYYDLPGVL